MKGEEKFLQVKSFCKKYKRPFSVLVLGREGHFALELAENFNGAFTTTEEKGLLALCKEKNNKQIMLLKKDLKLHELKKIGEVHYFDIILAFNANKYFDHPLGEVLDTLLKMCSYCFLERPNKKMYLIENLGIKKIERRWSGGKFYGDNKGIIINASFENISVNYLHRKENRSWLVGVNLRTFWEYGGIYPTREEILKTAGSMTVEGETLDLAPHNIILNNKALHLIDQKRKDSVCTKEKMMSYLTSFSKGRATGSY